MLTLRTSQTHRRRSLLGILVWIGCATAQAGAERVGVGDVRAGYEDPNYRSQSAALDVAAGTRLPLAHLASYPPLGLPALGVALDEAAVDLGRRLFFDRRLAANGTLSCAMCHVPEQGFAQNELATPVGMEGRAVRRNAPTLYNVAYVEQLFHDGREAQLDQQIWEPLLAENEMGNASRSAVVTRVAVLDDYAQEFARVFASGLNETTLGLALAAYQRGLLSGDSRFDRWYFGGEEGLLDALELQGFTLFQANGCASCHDVGEDTALFTNGGFYNTGIGYAAANRSRQPARIQLAPGVFVEPTIDVEVPRATDEGRFEVTGVEADRYRYRTPGLRNVALTAPYMHDGSLASLADVIAHYDRGGGADPDQDPRVRPLGLEGPQRRALLAFLRTLTGSNVEALAADARSVEIGDARSR